MTGNCQLKNDDATFATIIWQCSLGDINWTDFEKVRFTKIKNDSFPRLPDEVVAELSHDQEYLCDICWGVIDGSLEDDFECREPGALCHSRWITLANCILLLYVTPRKHF